MLPEEQKTKLVELGFDVDVLKSALTTDEEVSIEIPSLFKDKGVTREEMTVFGNNRFKEGQSSNEEILAKSIHDKYELGLADGKEGRKSIDKVIDAIITKHSTPSDNSAFESDFKQLQTKLQTIEQERDAERSSFQKEIFKTSLKQKLISQIPKGVDVDNNDIIDLFLLRNEIEQNDGSAVVKVNGEIKKDDLLNPVSVDNYFKGWLDSSGFVKKSGMGGSDSSSGSTAKFSDINEFVAYCKQNGKEAMSDEMQKYYLANKQ